MSFYQHATTFAGRPVVTAPPEGPLPAMDEPVAWSFSDWDYDGTVDYGLSARFQESFEAFVARAGAQVETLVIGAWGYAAFNEAPIAQLSAAAPRLPGLRALFLGDQTAEECEVSWMRVGDLTPILNAYPALEVLRVRGGELLDLDPVRHTALRELTIETGGLPGGLVDEILRCDLPALTSLELWLGIDQYGGDTTVDNLAPLFAGEVFPALRHLALRNAEHADDLAAALATAPIVSRLQSLDLSLGTLSDAGAAALLAGQPLTHLRKLDLHHHYLSPEMEAQLAAALPGMTLDVSDVQEPDGDERYTAVSE